ncbi:MAG: VOC family protein [Chloroflexi bacterium]|nr:VOC family protein [Chloroflexota bacterium]
MADFRLPDSTYIAAARFRVRDLSRSLGFYRDILGLQATEIGEHSVALSAGDSAPIITLVGNQQFTPKPSRSTGLYHVAILTPSRPALGKVLKRLVEANYPIGGASDHLVSEALYLSDPDGNGLEIYRDRRRDEWTYIQGDLQMATEPLNLRALVNAADPTPYDAIPTGTIIGHVHLHVSDLAKAEAFYNGVLGLDVVVRNYPGALFFSAGGYHHHLGTNTWAGRMLPPQTAVGLDWWDLVVPGAAKTVIERVQAAGLPITISGTGAALVVDQDGNQVRILNG